MSFTDNPQHSKENRGTELSQLDLVCDRFEKEWREGKRPSLKQYLEGVPVAQRQALLPELLVTEWELRRHLEEEFCLDEYATLFPAEAELVRSLWMDTRPHESRHRFSTISWNTVRGGESTISTNPLPSQSSVLLPRNSDTSRSAPRNSRELRELLQQRLFPTLLIAFLIWLGISCAAISGWFPFLTVEVAGEVTLVISLLTTSLLAAGTIAVATRDWSLRTLRWIEGAALVFFVAALAIYRVRSTLHVVELPWTVLQADRHLLTSCSLFGDFGWLSAILVFGSAIPHRWRIAQAIVLGIAACPMLIDITLLLEHTERTAVLLPPFLLTFPFLLGGVTLALFGTYKIHAVEDQVRAVQRALEVARRVGPYALRFELGRGGMGVVWLAEHRLLKRPCAVKLIRPERAFSADALARFDREVQATAGLTHPHTVQVFDYGRDGDGTFYYVMEYLDGVSLDKAVKLGGTFPESRVLQILVALCGALQEAHHRSLVHRDIKPSNILLCRYGGTFDFVKLVDFGLVHSHNGALVGDGDLTFVGTPEFAPPEQMGGRMLDGRADIYALGATAFYLLAGRPPFQESTIEAIYRAHRDRMPPTLDSLGVSISAELQGVITRCLAKRPEDRFADMVELSKALRECSAIRAWSPDQAQAWWDTIHLPVP